MKNTSKRIEGAAEELGGKIRGGLGRLIGNKKLQASGNAHVIEGKAKQEVAKVTHSVTGKR